MDGKRSNRKFRTFSGIAQYLGVSRTRVRNLLEDAQDASLLRIDRCGGGDYEVPPVPWRAYDRYVADMSANMDVIARLTGG